MQRKNLSAFLCSIDYNTTPRTHFVTSVTYIFSTSLAGVLPAFFRLHGKIFFVSIQMMRYAGY